MMRNQKIIVLIFSLIVFNGFGQKKELKSAEKALKSKNFVAAKENIVAAEKFDLLNADLKTKAKYHYIKGVAYYADGESSLDDSFIALDNFKKVISLEENSTYKTYTDKVNPLKSAMFNKFVTNHQNAYEKKDYKTSYSNLESAFKVSPTDTIFLYNAAQVAKMDKDFDVALEYFDQLINMNFTGITTNYYATEIESGEEQFFAIESSRDLVIKLKTHNNERDEITESLKFSILKDVATIYRLKENYTKSLEYINLAKSINSQDINLLLDESFIQWELGNKDIYKSLISKALEIDPNNADLLYNLGVISADTDDIGSAKSYYNRAIAADPKYTKAYLNLVVVMMNDVKPIMEIQAKLGNSEADYIKYDEYNEDIRNIYLECIPYLVSVLDYDANNIPVLIQLRSLYSAVGDEVNYMLMKEKVEELEN